MSDTYKLDKKEVKILFRLPFTKICIVKYKNKIKVAVFAGDEYWLV